MEPSEDGIYGAHADAWGPGDSKEPGDSPGNEGEISPLLQECWRKEGSRCGVGLDCPWSLDGER